MSQSGIGSKQCTVAFLLEKYTANDSYDWVTVVDGDTVVVKNERRLEEFIPEGNRADLIFTPGTISKLWLAMSWLEYQRNLQTFIDDGQI